MTDARPQGLREYSEWSQATVGKHSSHMGNHFVPGIPAFSRRDSPGTFWALANAFFATTLYRAWNLIVLSILWATLITLICAKVHDMSIQPTLLTVYGIVVGFTISYRTSSSFERYNEGRKLWSTIVLATRTFSRTVWFHVPDEPVYNSTNNSPSEETKAKAKAQTGIEKRKVIELVEAFSVGVKHYLRGEDGIEYEDLYHLVKYLPIYALPNSIYPEDSEESQEKIPTPAQEPISYLPQPAVSKETHPKEWIGGSKYRSNTEYQEFVGPHGLVHLAPASIPPRRTLYDIWPLSLLVGSLASNMQSMYGKRSASTKGNRIVAHNVPLAISFYLSSYISALQKRKGIIDVPTTNLLFASLNQLVESLSGLERILTNPIPFSYGIHLWTSCSLYIILMPFQIWAAFGYVTIPATGIAAFFFFGFLVAGEEIENPFGYDKNDLDLDSFCRDIISRELAALVSTPPSRSSPNIWACDNDEDYKSRLRNVPEPDAGSNAKYVEHITEERKQDSSDG